MKKKSYLKILIIFLLNYTNSIDLRNDFKKINVLLKQFINEEKLIINFRVIGKVKIIDFYNENAFFIFEEEFLTFEKKNNFWYLNGKKLKIKNIKIEIFENSYLIWNENSYLGDFFILNENENKTYLINKLYLEDYVCFVLGRETFGDWPIESHKVSAIISRTFAIYKMISSRKLNKLYDIKSTIDDQKYLGIFWHKNIINAVKETEDNIICYNDFPIISMYHICCGSTIPANFSGFDFEKFPYLKRTSICSFCKKSSNFNWSIIFNENEICEKLGAFFKKNISNLNGIENLKLTKSKSLKNITFIVYTKNKKGKKKKEFLKLSNKDFRKIFSITLQGKSSNFIPEFKNKTLKIIGKGRGHLVGLCQIGAKGMIDLNKNYKEILEFYYPKTTIQKINFIN